MSWDVSPWVYPVWDSLGFLDLGGYFLPHFREVFNYYLLKYFFMPFLFVFFFFWDFYDSMLGCLTFYQRSLRLSSLLLILFAFFPSASLIPTILPSISLFLASASVILLLIPSRVHYSLLIDSYWSWQMTWSSTQKTFKTPPENY